MSSQAYGGIALMFAAMVILCAPLSAQESMLWLHVIDTRGQPIEGIRLSPKGNGSVSDPTTLAGRTRIRLAPDTRAGQWVSLQVVNKRSDHQGWVFISPWDSRVLIPPFEEASENFAPIVLARRSDRQMLENPEALAAITSSILEQVSRKTSINQEYIREQRQEILAEQAKKFGLEPGEVDQAIRAWQQKTKDPYEKGLAALYAENYPESTKQLSESLRIRKSALKQAQADVVDAAFFLGQSLYQEGQYRASAHALREALALRSDDIIIIKFLGIASHKAGYYAKAEPLYQRALVILNKALGRNHPSTKMVHDHFVRLQGKLDPD
jgi:tetratricopeptide (TPR) repeat protein